jgi:hypothetical protein
LNCAVFVPASGWIVCGRCRLTFEIKDQLIRAAALVALACEILSEEIALVCSVQITMVTTICFVDQREAIREQDAP